MNVSVVIPAYNSEETLPDLLDSLMNQSYQGFETILVDDSSIDGTSRIARSYPCKILTLSKNRGPAYCRNIGADNARGDILAFTDSDCRVDRDWLKHIHTYFSQHRVDAIMGKLVLMPSTILGDSISAIGFPAGGAIGFDKIWKVDQNGFTDSLSSCNCAIRKDIFHEIGGFDHTFPYPGGEDSFLAYNLRTLNYTIKYCPNVLVYHNARDSFSGFLKWQFRRGVSSFIFSTKISNRKKFLSLRIWSTGNIVRHYVTDKKFPLILCLLGTSFFVQFIGFLSGRYSRSDFASINHQSTVAG